MAEEVVDPDGTAWKVRRRWDPRRNKDSPWGRTKDKLGERWQALDGLEGLELVSEIPIVAILIGVVALALFLGFVLIPLLLVVVELFVVLAVVTVAVVGRVFFGRPWLVEAAAEDGWRAHQWEVVGWRASGDHVRLVRDQLAAGMPLPEPLPDP